MSASVPSERAEEASGLLFRTVAAHRAAVSNLQGGRGIRRLAGPRENRADIWRQATLVRLLSITESFCTDRLTEEVEQIIERSPHASMSAIWDKTAINVTNSWEERARAYEEILGVELHKSDWTSIKNLAEARNAVAHGLGKLTRRQQQKRQSTCSKLQSCGIAVDGDTIELNENVLLRAAQTCSSFVKKLDEAVGTRPITYR